MTWDHYEYKIAEHLICALEYGDYGDMTEDEILQFEEWLECAQDGKTGHWSIDYDGEDFGRCAVSGMLANRVTVKYNFKDDGNA